MRTTFQKRQKEMKRLEKQRAKEERRAQKKLIKRAEKEAANENLSVTPETVTADAEVKPGPEAD